MVRLFQTLGDTACTLCQEKFHATRADGCIHRGRGKSLGHLPRIGLVVSNAYPNSVSGRETTHQVAHLRNMWATAMAGISLSRGVVQPWILVGGFALASYSLGIPLAKLSPRSASPGISPHTNLQVSSGDAFGERDSAPMLLPWMAPSTWLSHRSLLVDGTRNVPPFIYQLLRCAPWPPAELQFCAPGRKGVYSVRSRRDPVIFRDCFVLDHHPWGWAIELTANDCLRSYSSSELLQ